MDEAIALPTARRGSSAVLSGAIVGLLGFLTVAPLYLWIHGLQAIDKSAAALAMSSMHMSQMDKYCSTPGGGGDPCVAKRPQSPLENWRTSDE